MMPGHACLQMALAYSQGYYALQAAVLEDCVSSGMAYARLSCDGQGSLPSFASEFAHALAQVSHQALPSLQSTFCVSVHGSSQGPGVPWTSCTVCKGWSPSLRALCSPYSSLQSQLKHSAWLNIGGHHNIALYVSESSIYLSILSAYS